MTRTPTDAELEALLAWLRQWPWGHIEVNRDKLIVALEELLRLRQQRSLAPGNPFHSRH